MAEARILRTKSGTYEVQTTLTDEEAVAICMRSKRDAKVNDIILRYQDSLRGGRQLAEGEWAVIHGHALNVINPPEPAYGLHNIFNIFWYTRNIHANMFPLIHLHAPDIGRIKLGFASGATAAKPYTINVENKLHGLNFRRYGYIERDGDYQGYFYPTFRCTPSVHAVLQAFDRDPLPVLSEFGKNHGVCACCLRPLLPAQIVHGYCVVCEDRFSLVAQAWQARRCSGSKSS